MNITTLGKHKDCVKAFFVTANRHLEIDINIDRLFGGLKFSDDVPQASVRKSWKIDELNALFRTPIWSGTKEAKPSRRHHKGRRIIKDAYWWLPLIAIYSGMRLEEIAQLQNGDLKRTRDGIAFIEVSEGEGKRLKTSSSMRDVPVHPMLEDLGLITLFKDSRPIERIFPELEATGQQEKFSCEYSGDFTEYRRKVGLYEELKDFHSFRHTFATHLRRSIKDILMVGEIIGHETKQIETVTYTHPTVADKYEAILKLDYAKEGLDISHLFPTKGS